MLLRLCIYISITAPVTDNLSHPPLQTYSQHCYHYEESTEEVEEVDDAAKGGDLYDVGEDDLEAPDDHDRGGAGVDQSFVQTEGAGDAEEGLGDGEGPGLRPPGGEGGVGGVEPEEAQAGDQETSEPEPEDEDGGGHLGALLGDDRHQGGEAGQGERQADPRQVGGGEAGRVPAGAGRGVGHHLLLHGVLQAEDDCWSGDDENPRDEAAADRGPVEAAPLPQQAGGQQHRDGGGREGDGGEVSYGKSLDGSEDTEEHETAQHCLAGDEQPGLQVREGEEAGALADDGRGDHRHLQAAPEQEQLPGAHQHRGNIEQLDGGVTRED